MILFDESIEVFDLSEFNRFGKHSASFEICNGFGLGRILIDVDHSRG